MNGFEAWVREDLHTRVRLIIALVTLFTSVPLIGMSIYAWRVASTRGKWFRYLAIFSGVSGVLLAFLLWLFLILIERNTA